MPRRSRSAVVIVAVGILPALIGGPIFAAVFTAIAIAAYYEFIVMCGQVDSALTKIGYVSIVGFASMPLLTESTGAFAAVLVFALFAPLIRALSMPIESSRLQEWAITATGTLYLGVVTFAAITLRMHEGASDRVWVNDVSDFLSPASRQTGAGLGWFLFVLLVIWLSDTFAYLIGWQLGRNKLIPHISPNKTVEGAIGGLTAAAITGAVCAWAFGMGIHPAVGFGLGAIVSIAGMFGDLVESMLKRQAGVKDSGSFIPGHGGMLDRIDALIFGLLVTWIALPWLT